MLIILDIGAHDGCSILKFLNILKKRNITDYKIYSFEPNPYFKKRLRFLENKNNNITFFQKLVCTSYTQSKLYLSQKNDDGSSIYSDKQTNGVNNDVYIICDTIDIVNFIKNLPKYDELWVKMDIEGSEYKIITE